MTRRNLLRAVACGVAPGSIRAARPEGLEFAGCALFSCQVGRRSWVLLELRTRDGLTGLGDATAGEATPVRGAEVARQLIETMEGRGAFDIERLRIASRALVAAADPADRRATATTCSGMEQAMWDLQGKALGVPCYQLFGGKLRDRIRNYANINRATRGADRTAEGFARNALRAVEAGYDAFKLAPFDHIRRGEADGAAIEDGVRRGIGFVSAVRDAIGPDRELLIDGHSRFGWQKAVEVARRLEPFDLYWMEEMCAGTDALARFNDAVSRQTAGGESLWGVDEFLPYIQARAVDTVMPDVRYAGGMLELKEIASVAGAAGMLASPHGPASPLGNMAAAHVCATLPNFGILELAFGEVPWRAATVEPPEDVRNGYLVVPDRPGIGYEMNPDHWQRHDI